MARERSMLLFVTLFVAACPHENIDTDSTQTLSPESTMTTSPNEESSTSGGDASGCSNANQCEVGYCVAPYADNDRGDFVCVPDCVMPGDEASWCFDVSSCCDPDATCTERGYCVSPDDTTGSSTG